MSNSELLRDHPAGIRVALVCRQLPPSIRFSQVSRHAVPVGIPVAAASENTSANAVVKYKEEYGVVLMQEGGRTYHQGCTEQRQVADAQRAGNSEARARCCAEVLHSQSDACNP